MLLQAKRPHRVEGSEVIVPTTAISVDFFNQRSKRHQQGSQFVFGILWRFLYLELCPGFPIFLI